MPTTCHIYIYGDIVNIQAPNLGQSGAVSLTSVKNSYNANSTCTDIVVHIHSNGGSVYEGFAIHDRNKTTTAKADHSWIITLIIVMFIMCFLAYLLFNPKSD